MVNVARAYPADCAWLRAISAAVAITFSIGAAFPAQASSVLVNDGIYTSGPTTHDGRLDITETANLSYSEMFNKVSTNYAVRDWHNATADDLQKFYNDAAIGTLDFFGLVSGVNAGVTDVDQWYQAAGFFGARDNSSTFGRGGLASDLGNATIASGLSAIIDAGIPDTDSGLASFGAWLARHDLFAATTPIPGALFFFASALLLITLMNRRRRR